MSNDADGAAAQAKPKQLGRPKMRKTCKVCNTKVISHWNTEYVEKEMCCHCYKRKFGKPPASSSSASEKQKKTEKRSDFPPSPPAITPHIVPGTVQPSTPEYDMYPALSDGSTTQLMQDLDTAATDAAAAAAAAPLSAWQPFTAVSDDKLIASDILDEIATSDVLLLPGETPTADSVPYSRFDPNIKRKNGRMGDLVECVARVKKAKYGGEGNDVQKQSLRENAVDRLANYLMGHKFKAVGPPVVSIAGVTWVEEHYAVVLQRAYRMKQRARLMILMCARMCTTVQTPSDAMWQTRRAMMADVKQANAAFAHAIDMTSPSEHKMWENPEYVDQDAFSKKDGRVSRNGNRDDQQLNSRLVLSSGTSYLAMQRVLEDKHYTAEQQSMIVSPYVQRFRCSNAEKDTLATTPYKPDAANGLFVNPITSQGKCNYSTAWSAAVAKHVQPLTAATKVLDHTESNKYMPWWSVYPLYETLGRTRSEAALRAPLTMVNNDTFQIFSEALDAKKHQRILEAIKHATHATFSSRRIAHYGKLQLFKIKTVRSKEVFFRLETAAQQTCIETLCKSRPRGDVCVTFYARPASDAPANKVWFWKGASYLAGLA